MHALYLITSQVQFPEPFHPVYVSAGEQVRFIVYCILLSVFLKHVFLIIISILSACLSIRVL